MPRRLPVSRNWTPAKNGEVKVFASKSGGPKVRAAGGTARLESRQRQLSPGTGMVWEAELFGHTHMCRGISWPHCRAHRTLKTLSKTIKTSPIDVILIQYKYINTKKKRNKITTSCVAEPSQGKRIPAVQFTDRGHYPNS